MLRCQTLNRTWGNRKHGHLVDNVEDIMDRLLQFYKLLVNSILILTSLSESPEYNFPKLPTIP